MTTPNTDSLYNSMLLLTGKDSGTATLENSLAVAYKAKHATTICLGSYTSDYLSPKNKNYDHTHTCTQMFIAALSQKTRNNSDVFHLVND